MSWNVPVKTNGHLPAVIHQMRREHGRQPSACALGEHHVKWLWLGLTHSCLARHEEQEIVKVNAEGTAT
jgi:hypothetical protein